MNKMRRSKRNRQASVTEDEVLDCIVVAGAKALKEEHVLHLKK